MNKTALREIVPVKLQSRPYESSCHALVLELALVAALEPVSKNGGSALGFAALSPAFNNQIEYGNKKQIEHGGHDHSPENGCAHRVAALFAGALGQNERN